MLQTLAYKGFWSISGSPGSVRGIIGHLHDDIILLLRPESFRVLLSCAIKGFCYLNLTETTKLKYERKSEMNSGLSSKNTSSCKKSIWNKVSHPFKLNCNGGTEERSVLNNWKTFNSEVYTIHTHFLCFLLISVMNNWFLVRARIQELESVLLSYSITRQHYLVSFIQLCIFSQFIFFQPGGNLKEFINTRSEYTWKLTFM